jgi:hypothetical protein
MIKRIVFLLVILSGFLVYASGGTVSPERRDRSFRVFAGGIDTLLIDTEHVFVQTTDKVKGFYLDGTGAVFIGNISLTGSSNINLYIRDWIKWFKESDNNENDDGDEADSEKHGKPAEEETSGDAHASRRHHPDRFKNLRDEDEKRLQKMDTHIKAFVNELIMTMTDYGPILKGLSGNDRVVVVLFVKDRAFKDKYHDDKLMVSIPFKKLLAIQDLEPGNPKAAGAFTVNIKL